MSTSVVSSSNFTGCSFSVRPALLRECVRGVAVPGGLMQLSLVVRRQVRLDVEHDFLDGAGEPERLLVLVAQVNDPSVVEADIHPRVGGEADRDRVVHPAGGDSLAAGRAAA